MFPSSCSISGLSSLDSIAQINDLAKTKATHWFGMRLISLGSNCRELRNSNLLVYPFTQKIFMEGLGEWKTWLKAQHSENEDHGIWRPGVLQFMGSQRVGHDWAPELNWTIISSRIFSWSFFLSSSSEKYGMLHKFTCHPCSGAMLIFSVSFQF